MRDNLLTIIFFLLLLITATEIGAEFLSAAEVIAIGGGSLSLYGLGLWANNFDSTKVPLIGHSLPGDKAIQKLLGGQYYKGKSNFLDSRFGSAITPIAGTLILTSIELAWPSEGKGGSLSQNLFLYLSGVMATRGLTDLAKAAVARPRPYMEMASSRNENYNSKGYTYDHNSFFSGHTSGAFFIATFLNKHTRLTMRQKMNAKDYRDYRWLSPAVFYGWSTFVGWSRIHAWQHHFSDVAVGALAGWLIGELFYSFNKKTAENAGDANGQMLFQIRFNL